MSVRSSENLKEIHETNENLPPIDEASPTRWKSEKKYAVMVIQVIFVSIRSVTVKR